jgi:hypothetical protein
MRIPSGTLPKAALALSLVIVLGVVAAGMHRGARAPPAKVAALPVVDGVMPCRYHVMIIHDVHWAAACMNHSADEGPECMLPPERAEVLNKAQEEAERFCERRGT